MRKKGVFTLKGIDLKKSVILLFGVFSLLVFMIIQLSSDKKADKPPTIHKDYSQIETIEDIEGVGTIQQGEEDRQIYLDGFEGVFDYFPSFDKAITFKDNLLALLIEHPYDDYLVKNIRLEDGKLKLELHSPNKTILNVETKNTIAVIVPN